MNNGNSYQAGPPCYDNNCVANPWKEIASLSSGKDLSTVHNVQLSGKYMSAVTALVGQEGNLQVTVPKVIVSYTMGKLVKNHPEKIAPYTVKKLMGKVKVEFGKTYRMSAQPSKKGELKGAKCAGMDRLVRFSLATTTTTAPTTTTTAAPTTTTAAPSTTTTAPTTTTTAAPTTTTDCSLASSCRVSELFHHLHLPNTISLSHYYF